MSAQEAKSTVPSPDWKDSSTEWLTFVGTNARVVTTRDQRKHWCAVIECKSDDTLFLIHGAGGRSEQWFPVVKELQSTGTIHCSPLLSCSSPSLLGVVVLVGVNLVVPDLLGHGRSAKPSGAQDYTTAALVQDIEHLVQQFG